MIKHLKYLCSGLLLVALVGGLLVGLVVLVLTTPYIWYILGTCGLLVYCYFVGKGFYE